MTTWGESHGKAIGVVIDGCPAGVEISEEEIRSALRLRAPGNSPYTSPRQETDAAEILSGVYQGRTTGHPISIIIPNRDADSSKYEPVKHLLRPGHAQWAYLEKYGVFDARGGGRASARETACRVAAGAVAEKILNVYQVSLTACLSEAGGIAAKIDPEAVTKEEVRANPIFCPDKQASVKMMGAIEEAKNLGDSVGGVVTCMVRNVPPGLGEPVYAKMEAQLASAMMSLPAAKAFAIGSGFDAARMRGSEHNDPFVFRNGRIETESNHAGGTLGGITTGMPLVFRVAFKPPSGIAKPLKTVDRSGIPHVFQLPEGSRHDPCVAIRAVPVVEAMTAIVLADLILQHRSARLFNELFDHVD